MSISDYFRACQRDDLPCWICGDKILYVAGAERRKTGNLDMAFSKDHYWPISLKPDLRTVVDNWRPAHTLCNNRRGNRTPNQTLWIGDMWSGRWETETAAEAKKRIDRERRKRANPGFGGKFVQPEAPLTWSERWSS